MVLFFVLWILHPQNYLPGHHKHDNNSNYYSFKTNILKSYKKMLLDFAKKAQIGFQDPATPLAEGIVDLHHTIFFWLIIIFTPVVIIFFRIIKRSNTTWDNPTKFSLIVNRDQSLLFNRIIHGTLLEIIWTITPTIILIAIAIPSFGLIYAMDSINDPDWTVKVIGNQWYWTYDFNFGAMLMTDIQEIYLAATKNNSQHAKFKALAYTPEIEKIVVEKTIKLWKHNVNDYLIDSYTLTENTENRNVRLLSTDNPLFVPVYKNIRVLLTSVDVLHSFAVPSLGVKLDATPGRLGAISLFVERPGQFFGQCSELCGVQHGFMSLEIYAK